MSRWVILTTDYQLPNPNNMAAKAQVKTQKSQKKEVVPSGMIYISATFNNTIVTLTDPKGNTLAWGSSGRAGYKGTRKSTPFAATQAVDAVVKRARDDFGMQNVDVFIKGPGPGRDAALRAIRSAGLKMEMIADKTPMPHNGPRARKKRRG